MVYFLTKIKLENYLTDPRSYTFQQHGFQYGFGIQLELLETNFPYYILKNASVKGISLTDNISQINPDDLVVFYNCCENKAVEQLDGIECKRIQIVTDTPIIPNCDGYVSYDPSIPHRDKNTSRQWFHVLYPMPIGLKKCKPSWPPTNISTISPGKMTTQRDVPSQYNIIDDSYCNRGDEDVLFHVRKKITYNHKSGIVSRMKFPSHKTANRLYQSWYCNTPGIFSSNTAMDHIRETEFDFLMANDIDELNEQVTRLKTDRDLFQSMVDVCIRRQNENNYARITSQWLDVFDHYE